MAQTPSHEYAKVLDPVSGGAISIDEDLIVFCLIGNPPPGGHEGIHVNVNDLINFNKLVSGETVYIQQ